MLAAAAGCVGAAPSVASAQAAKPFRDVRSGERRAVERRGDTSLRAPGAATRSARARLRGSLEVDTLTGTPRVLEGAPLAGPSAGDPAEVAMGYVRAHLALLGLAESDVSS